MASDFWKILSSAAMMGIRDHNKEKEKQIRNNELLLKKSDREEEIKAKRLDFIMNSINEISDAAIEISDMFTSIVTQANQNYIPKEIEQGYSSFLAYAFYNVLQAQGGIPTSEQTQIIDIFFNNIDFHFTKSSFLDAVKKENETKQYIESLIGISIYKAGKFWQLIFKAIYMTNSDDIVLSKITKTFSTFVMQFAVFGILDDKVKIHICEEFINAFYKQINECRKLPEESLDVLGEVSSKEHYRRMQKLINTIVCSSEYNKEIDFNEYLTIFTIGLLNQLIKSTKCNINYQSLMTEKALQISNINFKMSGYEIIEQLKKTNEFYEYVNYLVSINDNSTGFWGIIILIAKEENKLDDALEFLKECTSYLMGIETELSKNYKFCGFGNIAKNYMMEILDKVENILTE